MMRTLCFYLGFLLLLSFVGCGGKHHSSHPDIKRFLTDVEILDDNTVVATVDLPEGHYGFLFLNDSLVALEIVVADGPVNLGVFSLGDFNLCLELFISPSGQVELDNYWATHKRQHFTQVPFKSFAGVLECCDFEVLPLDVPPVDPPVDPPADPPVDPPVDKNPKIKCRVNYDGAVVLIVNLRGYGPVILQRIGSDYEYLIDANYRHVVEDLDCGDVGYVLLDPETKEELDRCTFSIPCPPELVTICHYKGHGEYETLQVTEEVAEDHLEDHNKDSEGECDDDPRLPPKPPKHPKYRFFVCHNGQQLLVPWGALKAHLVIHGDKLGRCDDNDD